MPVLVEPMSNVNTSLTSKSKGIVRSYKPENIERYDRTKTKAIETSYQPYLVSTKFQKPHTLTGKRQPNILESKKNKSLVKKRRKTQSFYF